MKKAITLSLAALLFSGSFPIAGFANEVNQPSEIPTEEVAPAPENPEEPVIDEPKPEPEAPEIDIPSVDPIPEAPEKPETPEIPVKEEAPATPSEAAVPETAAVTPVPEVAQYQQQEPAIQEVTETVVVIDYSSIHFDRVATTEEFIEVIGESAREVAKENDLFASVMIAQAILESGSGGSQLSQAPYFNLFGIKGEYEGQSVTFATYEDDGAGNLYQIDSAFRAYPSYKESFEDYSELLTGGLTWNETFYQGTWKSVAGDYQGATQALTGTYATDTSYNLKLNGLIETYDLTTYDREKSDSDPGTAATHEDSDFSAYSGANQGAYAYGNCTQFAHNRMVEVSGKAFSTSLGNAKDWSVNATAQGYPVTNNAVSGSVVVFQPGVAQADPKYGHVGFTEHVYEDGSILISEMNVVGLNIVSYRVIPAATAKTLSYINQQ